MEVASSISASLSFTEAACMVLWRLLQQAGGRMSLPGLATPWLLPPAALACAADAAFSLTGLHPWPVRPSLHCACRVHSARPQHQQRQATSEVHALNILRALFKDTRLGENIIPYVADGMQAAILGFTSSLWAVRNSSTLLFSTLITRIFGVKRGKDENSKKNRSVCRPLAVTLTELSGHHHRIESLRNEMSGSGGTGVPITVPSTTPAGRPDNYVDRGADYFSSNDYGIGSTGHDGPPDELGAKSIIHHTPVTTVSPSGPGFLSGALPRKTVLFIPVHLGKEVTTCPKDWDWGLSLGDSTQVTWMMPGSRSQDSVYDPPIESEELWKDSQEAVCVPFQVFGEHRERPKRKAG
ncbi:UNVERIFIED_CONTAM: hypothetical protein K2H54_045718 [Gekko kuhli]